MEKNCLATKLKVAVNNPNPSYLGFITGKYQYKEGENEYTMVFNCGFKDSNNIGYYIADGQKEEIALGIYNFAKWGSKTSNKFLIPKYNLTSFMPASDAWLCYGIDFSEFINCPELITLHVKNFNSDVLSVIRDLAECMRYNIKLETLSLQSNYFISGSLESLAEAQINSGRTSGTLSVTCNGIVTFQGFIVGNGIVKTITFSNSSYVIE